MVQTFDDMLNNEPSRTGRWLIWLRTILDLPTSAAREYLTNEGDIMNRNTKLIAACSLLAVIIVGLGSFWFGSLRARQSIGIERVTAAQLADAMQQDNFYSSYGNSALLFSAKVLAVRQSNNASLVKFATNRPYSVTCQFPSTQPVKPGQTISVVAPGGNADRQKTGVLLHDCVNNHD